MNIEKLKKINKNEHKVYLSNGKELTLYDDIILKYELLITKKISERILKSIIKENDEKKAYFLALKKINRKMQTENEIRMYLQNENIDESTIKNVINDLIKQRYLNDKLYVETFINDSINLTNNGPLKIRRTLLNKGINSSLIDNHLDKINNNIWIEKTKKIINKKALTSKDSLYVFKTKMSNNLINLGYTSDLFSCNFNKVKLDDKKLIKEKATKEWTKLSKKYKDKELIYRFKNSMFQKGFSLDDINSFLEKII